MTRRIDVAIKSQEHGKLVRACVVVDGDRATAVTFTGDFFLEPAELLDELSACMSDVTAVDAGPRARTFFDESGDHMLIGAGPDDFAAAVVKALTAR